MPVRPRGIFEPRVRDSEPRASARAAATLGLTIALSSTTAAAAVRADGGVPGVPPNHGFNFATITHPGNAPWVGQRNNFGKTISWGDVDYTYRIATTEVTNSQWLGFVRAAAPFVPVNERNDPAFTGLGTTRQGGQYILTEPGNNANRVGWRYGAWYCNWLMAGAPPAGVATAADFATGAYDISTFNYTGVIGETDQARRSDGALYWIPSIDEWIKAVHWDPNRYGADQPGYWLHPGGQETPLIAGPPPTGQTNRGAIPGSYAIGQYPGTNLPWGLLDASGGATEWFEDKIGVGRWMTISELAPRPDGANVDRLNWKYGDDIYHLNGLRIASLVPAPSSLAPWLCFSLTLSRRKRPCRDSLLSSPPRVSEPRASARAAATLGLTIALCSTTAAAAVRADGGVPGVPPNHGFNFATITHPGNDPWVGVVAGQLRSWGRVDTTYRMATTEVTYTQWFDFVRAAAPFVPANEQNDPGFTGHHIVRVFGNYVMTPGVDHWGVEAGWRYAAMYCNWLHNGARPMGVATAADFASGAYDISTFTQNPDGTLNDQAQHSADALFWIPTRDEWTKAVYFDPERHGSGQAGYWLYPGRQDTPPISAPASQGGQSSVGAADFPGVDFPLDVGSYPDFNSPWGLLDVSGSVFEWFENQVVPGGQSRLYAISSALTPLSLDPDRISRSSGTRTYSSLAGIRIASAVPSPGAALTLGCVALPVFTHRRRQSEAPRRAP